MVYHMAKKTTLRGISKEVSHSLECYIVSEQSNHIITYTHFDNRLGKKDGTRPVGTTSK